MADHKGLIRSDLESGPPADDPEEEQLPLLPDAMAGLKGMGEVEAVKRSGPGRRAGSRNRRDQELVDFCRQQGFRTPIERWFSLINTPIEVMAEALGCSKLEAAQLQERAMANLAPYVHARRVPEIEAGDEVGGLVVINLGTNVAPRKGQNSAVVLDVSDEDVLDVEAES